MKQFMLVTGLALVLTSCATVDMPQGTGEGYSSVRFVRIDPHVGTDFAESSDQVNDLIQHAITDTFQGQGFEVGTPDADLIVGFLLLIQDNVSTTTIGKHFGYSDDKDKLAALAHKRGVVKGKHAEYYHAGAVVIDLIDAKTNELIYRNFAKRDILRDVTDEQRITRINDAVQEVLEGFFQ